MGSRLTVFQKILLLLALPVGLQGVVIVALLIMQQRAVDGMHWVSHTQEVLSVAHRLAGAANETHSSVRGQAVVQSPRLVEVYEDATKAVDEQADKLVALVKDNPEQSPRARSIHDKAHAFLDWAKATVSEIHLGDSAAALERLRRLDGQRRVDEMRVPLNELIKAEEALDQQRRQSLIDSEAIISRVIVVSFLLMLAASAFMAWTLRRGFVERLAHLQENAQRVARRHPLLPPLEGDDEFTKLDVQFRAMASRLETLADRDRRYAAGLETTIAQQVEQEERLRSSFEALRKEAEVVRETSRLKSEFLANMSHELRTPLNSIIGFAELMHDERVGPISEDHKEFLGDILTSSRHLLQLINDVLDLAKVEAGRMEFFAESFNVSAVVQEVCDLLRTQAAVKRIRIDRVISESIGPVKLDIGKFKQVLFNFLSNAIKFTAADGKITVRVSPEGKDDFTLAVEDTGVGISDEDVSRLFVEFTQLDASRTKKHQGTGLGLSLTRRIVEAQGGRVGVRSKVGEGSTFFAVLPREFSSFDESGQPVTTQLGGPRKRRDARGDVLVIEDDGPDREWLTNLLNQSGYSTKSARTGREAIDYVTVRRFNSIVLDLVLPDMTGWEVLRAIRQSALNTTTPVVIATIVADRSAAAGFRVDGYLVKPVQSESLLSALRNAGVAPNGDGPVMVVDDDATALKLVERTLEPLGYNIVTCSDPKAGLEQAIAKPPQVIIVDLMMPTMSGFEFLEELRKHKSMKHTPVIVWTTQELSSTDLARLRSSAQAVVSKREGGVAALLEELREYAGALNESEDAAAEPTASEPTRSEPTTSAP